VPKVEAVKDIVKKDKENEEEKKEIRANSVKKEKILPIKREREKKEVIIEDSDDIDNEDE
jgi:hypothetical protein